MDVPMVINQDLINMLFVILILITLITMIFVLISIYNPKWRIWPPPEKNSWQFYLWWFFISVIQLGVLLIGLLDWGDLKNFHLITIILSIPMILIGMFLAITGAKQLSIIQTMGLEGKLQAQGLYKYSRNPQYVGYFFINLSIILFMYSFYCFILGSITILLYFLLPFSEERWLQERYNGSYIEYIWSTPRFGIIEILKKLNKFK